MSDDRRRNRGAAFLLAILLAFLFRLFISSEEVAEKTFRIPIRYAAVPDSRTASLPGTALVTLSGPRIVLWRVRQEQLSAVVDSGKAPKGGGAPVPCETEVRVPQGTRLLRVDPQHIDLK
jgi:hypothetical protein